MPKVVLAYSGSLDTIICLHFLKNVKGFKVYTFSADIGQFIQLEPLAEEATELGATTAYIADLKNKFAKDFVYPCLRANARYENGYFLFSALSKPLIVQELVRIAREEECEFIAHGSRGIGNDSYRFENCIKAIASELKIIAPLSEIGLKNSKDDISFAKEHNIKINCTKEGIYNIEQNLWGCNIQIRDKNFWCPPPLSTYLLTVPISEAPDAETFIEIEFEKGLPTRLNGEEAKPEVLIDKLNKIGGKNAIGRYDMIEDRISGVKTREIYESPAATILYTAHMLLESAVFKKEMLDITGILSNEYANLVYKGEWFSLAKKGLDAFFENINVQVTGKVKLALHKGNIIVKEINSPNTFLG